MLGTAAISTAVAGLVASDGGVFTFGAAEFAGSAGAVHLASPVVGSAGTAPFTVMSSASSGRPAFDVARAIARLRRNR